jgi:AraC family transcriptional regulator
VGAAIAIQNAGMPVARFAVTEEVCLPTRRGRLQERQYAAPALGVVLSGCVDYRAQGGSATAVPGAVIFANAGEHFTCRHRTTLGNRRLVVTFHPDFLNEVALVGGETAHFRAAVIAPGKISCALFGQIRRLRLGVMDAEEIAFELAASALQIDRTAQERVRVSARDRQRVVSVVRHLEQAFPEPCSLTSLAQRVQLSPYYFLRMFKRVTGQSPAQYVLNLRLRATADELLVTQAQVAQIAFRAGFNDLSHFNSSFRRAFGMNPARWRQGVRP